MFCYCTVLLNLEVYVNVQLLAPEANCFFLNFMILITANYHIFILVLIYIYLNPSFISFTIVCRLILDFLGMRRKNITILKQKFSFVYPTMHSASGIILGTGVKHLLILILNFLTDKIKNIS